MGKLRVYELAQRLGLDNKTLLERLNETGIEAKSHMSVLEEEDVQKAETALAEPTVTVEKVEEERITPGIIRRRRREVPQPAAETRPEPEEAAEVSEAPSARAAEAEEEDAEAAKPAEPEPVSAPEPEETVPSAPEEAVEPDAEPPAEVAAEEPPAPAAEVPSGETKPQGDAPPVEPEPVKPSAEAATKKKPAQPAKATPTQAKILGRVELPTPAKRGDEGGRRVANFGPGRREPAGRGREETKPRPARGPAPPPGGSLPPAGVPLPEKEGRGKKKKKGRGAEAEGMFRDRNEARRRRERREVFEPERDGKLRRGRKGGKASMKTEVTVAKAIKRKIRISDVITVGELAKRMGIKANDLIRELMRQGNMVTINHPLDFETAALLASDFNYEVENVAFDEETILSEAAPVEGQEEKPEDLRPRPPVVTIMGHVDHGKTSLLDAIRTTEVTAGEAGGITQHIGAYDVEIDGRKITFLDTPGHEAFTAMRSRGAKVTDIVVLVVAADDGVMPQTKEAINHAKAAEVPIVVAVNKIDKPDANPDRVKQELTEFELVPEDWGGDTIFVEVSAKQHTNLEQLLEMILLQSEVLELKANPDKRARGTIVEARLDRGRGPVATVLVQEGTLRIGDPIVSGLHHGRVRTMRDDRGEAVEEAGPSFPVEVTGLTGVPDAGDSLHAVEDEKAAKEVAQHRQQKMREAELATTSKISLDQLYARIQQGDVKELKVIIKGDVQGSVEAVKDSLTKLSTEACRLVVIHSAVGGIIESDISLASASDAIVLGFNVRPEAKASLLAETEGVDIRLYNIIYDAVADIRDAMEGLLAPTLKEVELGKAEVRETFSVSKVGTIAGCYVIEGKAVRNAQTRLVRDSVVVWRGKVSSLKRFKDDVREVASGYECGIGLENFNDIKVGDVIEFYEVQEVKTTL